MALDREPLEGKMGTYSPTDFQRICREIIEQSHRAEKILHSGLFEDADF